MEGEVGPQVAPPSFFHHHHQAIHDARLLAKKRDLPWKNHIFQHVQSQESQQCASLSNSSGNWNPKMWDWDSVRFTATPAPDAADLLFLGSRPSSSAASVVDLAKKGNEGSKDSKSRTDLEEDNGELALKLGGGSNLVEEPAGARPSKKVRSGTPGTSSNYPMCQVDDCRTDLSCAKDYHRRHKVCEAHSKTAKALVGNQMQRFCQQCSRFHPLSEFDEGKRSCRRRLAGHNRRRRKTQPEDSSSKLLPPKNQENMISGNLDIVKLLAILSPSKGSYHGKPSGVSPPPDSDRLVQLISKLSASISVDPSERATTGGFDLNACQDAPLGSLEKSIKEVEENNAPSTTTNMLAVISAALAASITPPVPASLSQGSSKSSGNLKAIVQNADPSLHANLQDRPTNVYSSVALTSKGISQSPLDVPHQVVQQPHQSLPLQLFGPSGDDNPPAEGFAIKYLSSESSNPTEERSPSSSSPVTKKLFPLHSTLEGEKYTGRSHCREENAIVELSTAHGASATLDLFQNFERPADHVGYKSNCSDHSPSSSNSDVQDRTGRIIFKLFGKDPSNFPDALRAQVFNWLSNSPSDMESYIRPGCVVLSIYLSMPSIAWEELEGDLLRRVTSLIQCSETEFWRNARFLICTNRQLVSHKDGKIRVSKNLRAWTAPEVTSISPVAVVAGKETSLVLKGRNLTVPGTKIHCTYRGKYMSKEVLCSTYPGTIYDDSCVESFDFPGGFQDQLGRCFIEVENGFKGNSFPIIIANANICQELRTLEVDFHQDFQTPDAITEDKVSNSPRYRSKKDVLHFLNELGWLFQRTHASSNQLFSDFSISRFKCLLTFSVERDWCALIRTLLDILVQRSLKDDSSKHESLELLSEVRLLNRAVKRKCKKMVEFLIHYCVVHGSYATKVYLFPPNMAGPGGFTPLHTAASMQDSVDMVDVLTDDPQGIGLKCWNSVLDDNHQSPYMYAMSRNNISYNNLVARKLADRKNGQVTISFEGEKFSSAVDESRRHGSYVLEPGSCAQCAMTRTVLLRRTPHTGLLQRPYVHSMLAIAAVCVCVCLLLRGSPQTGSVDPFRWEKLDFGPR